MHIDFSSRFAQLIDPGVGNEMLSTTNWFDKTTGELWFASWSVEGTARRILNPRENYQRNDMEISPSEEKHQAGVAGRFQ